LPTNPDCGPKDGFLSGTIPILAIAPDGKRFAVVMPADTADDQKPPTQMIFLFNFFDELRRRVPSDEKK